jgi:phage recombination protein Bet
MSGELAVSYTATDGTEVSLTRETVARYLVTGGGQASDPEVAAFLAVCRARGLNPLARDAYLIKYGDRPAATVVGKDYFTRTAAARETFEGYEAGVVVAGRDGQPVEREGSFVLPGETLLGGWARVHDSRRRYPAYDSVSLAEYSTGKSGWAKMPATMVRKVALVHALREAYPDSFGGLYDSAEVERGDRAPEAVPAVPVEPEGREGRARPPLDAGQAEALRQVAAYAAARSGMAPDEARRAMCAALGDPRGRDFAAYAASAQAWAASLGEGPAAQAVGEVEDVYADVEP